MDIPVFGTIASRARRRGSLSLLGKVTVAALFLAALAYLTLIMGAGFSSDAVSIFAPHIALALVLALLVGAGFRWAPGLATVVMAGLVIETLVFAHRELTDPGDLNSFTGVAVLLGGLAIGIAAGVGTTVENYRRHGAIPGARAWLRIGVVGVAALALGAILTAAIQQPWTATGISSASLATLPTVTTKDFKYDPPEIQAKVGETVALRLVNADSTTHYFEIDELDVHVTMGPDKTGLAVFRPMQSGTYLIYCGAHSDKHDHTGMVGTLIVTE